MKDIFERIELIEQRNKKVEGDKAWEISKTRIMFLAVITYVAAVLFLYFIDAKNIFLNALVPVIGYLVSVQSLSLVKKFWLTKIHK